MVFNLEVDGQHVYHVASSGLLVHNDCLGDLTPGEIAQIQSVVDAAGRPLEVVGSAAEGVRREIGSKLPFGKGPGTRSDIDYLIPPSSRQHFADVEDNLPDVDPLTGVLLGISWEGPELTGNFGVRQSVFFESAGYGISIAALSSNGWFERGLVCHGREAGRRGEDAQIDGGVCGSGCCLSGLRDILCDEGSCCGTVVASSGCDAVSDDPHGTGSAESLQRVWGEDDRCSLVR
jgi:hypothetical protein